MTSQGENNSRKRQKTRIVPQRKSVNYSKTSLEMQKRTSRWCSARKVPPYIKN